MDTSSENRGGVKAAHEIETTTECQQQKPERLWTPVFVVTIAVTLCCFVTGQGLNAGTSVYLEVVGASATLAGIGALLFSLGGALTRLLCGALIDAKGRAIIMAIGAIVLAAGTFGPVISNHDAAFALWRIMQGAGFALSTTAAATAAADVLPLSRLGEGIGYYGLGQAIAMSVGPALAIFLVSTNPPENLYFGLTFIAAMALAFSFLCRYENDPTRLPETSAYRSRWERAQKGGQAEGAAGTPLASQPKGIAKLLDFNALPGAVPMLVLCPTFAFGIFFVGLYGAELNVGNAGLFYTLSAISMILVRLQSKAFMDTVPAIKIMTIAVASGLACFAMLLACGTFDLGGARDVVFYAAGLFYGASLGLSMPLNQAVAVKNCDASRWGAANALFMLAIDVSMGVASAVWGVVNDQFGFTVSIVCVMCVIAASLVAAWIYYPAEDKRWRKAR